MYVSWYVENVHVRIEGKGGFKIEAVLLVIIVVLGIGLLSLAVGGAVMGAIGVVVGGSFLRCQRCHRYGLAVNGQLHVRGCPSKGGERLTHPFHGWSHRAHL